MSQQRLQIILDLQKIIAKFVVCRSFYISSKNSATDSSAVGSKHAIWDEKQRVVTYLTKFLGNFEIGLFTLSILRKTTLHIFSSCQKSTYQHIFDIQLSVLFTGIHSAVYLAKALTTLYKFLLKSTGLKGRYSTYAETSGTKKQRNETRNWFSLLSPLSLLSWSGVHTEWKRKLSHLQTVCNQEKLKYWAICTNFKRYCFHVRFRSMWRQFKYHRSQICAGPLQ